MQCQSNTAQRFGGRICVHDTLPANCRYLGLAKKTHKIVFAPNEFMGIDRLPCNF